MIYFIFLFNSSVEYRPVGWLRHAATQTCFLKNVVASALLTTIRRARFINPGRISVNISAFI